MKKILKKISILILLIAGGGFFALYFNRSPERTIPQGNSIVSPANGEVEHIEIIESNEVKFFKKDIENVLTVHKIEPPYTVILIEMNLKNVHIQRAPIDGEVVYQKHFPGKHKNALSKKNTELVNTNEKNFIVFKNDDLSMGVVQVAGRAARRVRSFVQENDVLKKGEIYGRIVLGSQVVVILPEKIKTTVKLGDILIDGESIIAKY